MFPFREEILEDNKKYVLVKREFENNLSSEELVWHRDREDRDIILKEGAGWYIQYDNKLPILMEKEINYSIPKETWHRIINKNNTKLIIEVKKYK